MNYLTYEAPACPNLCNENGGRELTANPPPGFTNKLSGKATGGQSVQTSRDCKKRAQLMSTTGEFQTTYARFARCSILAVNNHPLSSISHLGLRWKFQSLPIFLMVLSRGGNTGGRRCVMTQAGRTELTGETKPLGRGGVAPGRLGFTFCRGGLLAVTAALALFQGAGGELVPSLVSLTPQAR